MKLIHDPASFFLHLLLLAVLFVQSSSRPVHAASLCSTFTSVIHHLDMLMSASKKLPDLPEGELNDLDTLGHRLDSLPKFEHTVAHFGSVKVNESLSQLYANTESFRLHVDWLKTAKHNNSLPSQPTEGASTHLLKISSIVKNSLQQISAEVPQPATPSLPVVSTAFDTLRFSVEISERLRVFSSWSKRLLRHFQRQTSCNRR